MGECVRVVKDDQDTPEAEHALLQPSNYFTTFRLRSRLTAEWVKAPTDT